MHHGHGLGFLGEGILGSLAKALDPLVKVFLFLGEGLGTLGKGHLGSLAKALDPLVKVFLAP